MKKSKINEKYTGVLRQEMTYINKVKTVLCRGTPKAETAMSFPSSKKFSLEA